MTGQRFCYPYNRCEGGHVFFGIMIKRLTVVFRLYPDHLAALDGLFGFELSSAEDYNAVSLLHNS